MLTFGEPEADDNFRILQEKAPHAKRIDGIEGLLNAHKACAEESKTNYFYVCDADAVITENFAFKFEPSDRREAYPGVKETECVFTYRSHNPINDLIYGYGAVKLFPKKELRYFNPNEKHEFETSIAYADIADEGTDSTSIPIGRNKDNSKDIYITDVVFSKLTSEGMYNQNNL